MGELQRLLVLDRVQDPGNVGTLIRTATALGWQGVFFTKGNAPTLPEGLHCSLKGFFICYNQMYKLLHSAHLGPSVCAGCCDALNDKALRASRGAIFKLPWMAGDWEELYLIMKKHSLTCFAAEPQSEGSPLCLFTDCTILPTAKCRLLNTALSKCC